MELRGEEVDYSDILYYLASRRWASREEDMTYLECVARGELPSLHPNPPDRREVEHENRVRHAHHRLHLLLWLELEPLDPLWDHMWRMPTPGAPGGLEDIGIFLIWLPTTPTWDPRVLRREPGLRANIAENKARLEAELEQEAAIENKGGDES